MAFLTPKQAAVAVDYSLGYLNYLRTVTATEAGHYGPPYYRVDLKDGLANPIRIKYDQAELMAWKTERDEQRAGIPPVIEHVAAGGI